MRGWSKVAINRERVPRVSLAHLKETVGGPWDLTAFPPEGGLSFRLKAEATRCDWPRRTKQNLIERGRTL